MFIFLNFLNIIFLNLSLPLQSWQKIYLWREKIKSLWSGGCGNSWGVSGLGVRAMGIVEGLVITSMQGEIKTQTYNMNVEIPNSLSLLRALRHLKATSLPPRQEIRRLFLPENLTSLRRLGGRSYGGCPKKHLPYYSWVGSNFSTLGRNLAISGDIFGIIVGENAPSI